jgi:hypothetical protein
MPDEFDRILGLLDGNLSTKPAPLQNIPLLGVGGVKTYIVRTFREVKPDPKDETKGKPEFWTAIIITGKDGTYQHVLPPKVVDLMIRQRESLQAIARKRVAKALATARAKAGIQPAFLKKVEKTS